LFKERRLILNKTLDNIDIVASKIAGLGLEPYKKPKTDPEGKKPGSKNKTDALELSLN